MHKYRHQFGSIVVALIIVVHALWVSPAAAQEAPAIYEMIPGNAQLAFVIPDLDQFNRKVRKLNKLMKLDNPGLNDVLDEFRRTTGMTKGIDDKGGLIIAILEMRGMSETRTPKTLMLVPISDYADFVGNFDGSARSPVTSLQMSWGQNIFCKQSGDHAVLSSIKSLVEGYRSGSGQIRVDSVKGTLVAQYLEKGDVAVVLDSSAGGKAILEQFDAMVDLMKDSVDEAMPDMAALLKPLIVSMGGLLHDGINTTVSDTELAVLTIELSDEGVGFNAVARLKAGSGLSKLFSEPKPNELMGLKQLPLGKYLTASTFDLRSFNLKQALTSLQSTLEDRNLAAIVSTIEQQANLYEKVNGISTVRYAPEQLSFTSQMGEAIVIDATDGRAFVAAFRSYIDGMDDRSIDLGQWPGPSGKIDKNKPNVHVKISTQYTSGAQLIEGTRVDQYLIERNFPPQLSASLGPMFGWIMMVSGREQKGYIAVVDRAVIFTTSDDVQLLRKMVLGARQTSGLGTKSLMKQTRKNLPAKAMYQWYLSTNDIAKMFNQAVKTMEWDFDKIDVKEPLPPIGIGVEANPKGLAKRLFMPMSVLRAYREPVMMIYEILTEEEEQMLMTDNRGGGFGPDGPGGPRGLRGRRGGRPGQGPGGGPFGPGGGFGPTGRPGGGGGQGRVLRR